MHVNRHCKFRRQICDQENQKDSKIQGPYKRNKVHVECKIKSDTNNNQGNWNHFRMRKYLSNILGKHDSKELQKTAILGTVHITVSLILTGTYYINTVLNNNHNVSETASIFK